MLSTCQNFHVQEHAADLPVGGAVFLPAFNMCVGPGDSRSTSKAEHFKLPLAWYPFICGANPLDRMERVTHFFMESLALLTSIEGFKWSL
jgi:hypothetical protein